MQKGIGFIILLDSLRDKLHNLLICSLIYFIILCYKVVGIKVAE